MELQQLIREIHWIEWQLRTSPRKRFTATESTGLPHGEACLLRGAGRLMSSACCPLSSNYNQAHRPSESDGSRR